MMMMMIDDGVALNELKFYENDIETGESDKSGLRRRN